MKNGERGAILSIDEKRAGCNGIVYILSRMRDGYSLGGSFEHDVQYQLIYHRVIDSPTQPLRVVVNSLEVSLIVLLQNKNCDM